MAQAPLPRAGSSPGQGRSAAPGPPAPPGAGISRPGSAGGPGPRGLAGRCRSALASNSHLVLSHAAADRIPSRVVAVGHGVYARAAEAIHLRTNDQNARFFVEGTELVPPCEGGPAELACAGAWEAEGPGLAGSDGPRVLHCGVARCP
jgi:hypothetical protein